MNHPGFFERRAPMSAAAVAEALGLGVTDPSRAEAVMLSDVRPIDHAQPGHLTFVDNTKYQKFLGTTEASACLVHPSLAEKLHDGTLGLTTKAPYRAFASALALFYPDAGHPLVAHGADNPEGHAVHPTAVLEEGVTVGPGAIVCAEAHIGRGTVIAPNAVVGYRVHIGRNGYVGPGVTVTHALVGDRVVLHGGVQIGQDGFGFAMGPEGHLKVPQIGRVIIQDDVEIGAGSTVDRGALNDTVIGEGTKIDNLVQIGHNVQIGRHCVIVSSAAISGSTVLEDFVVMGGQSGVVGHVRVGMGAQLAARAGVTHDVAPGAQVGGFPARPIREWAREVAALRRLVRDRTQERDTR